uniref:Uncharacterized protein n=1 Tax=Anopheles culicifacies TaxID=139723 RepID=A0A182LWX2_9DIPT
MKQNNILNRSVGRTFDFWLQFCSVTEATASTTFVECQIHGEGRSANANSMVGQRIANSLLKRSAFSSALNVLPNEATTATATLLEPTIQQQQQQAINEQFSHARPYTDVPGPKGLPMIGNSWRFAPIIASSPVPADFKIMKTVTIQGHGHHNHTPSKPSSGFFRSIIYATQAASPPNN